jgi:hypothetical protein
VVGAFLGDVFAKLAAIFRPKPKLRNYEAGNLDVLINNHFSQHSDPNHINRVGLTLALRLLDKKESLIIETGSSAWGTNSSLLFDAYVREYGGLFITVDIREEASQSLLPKLSEKSQSIVSDSVEFLQKLSLPSGFKKVDLVYLDSFDLDVLNPEPSMQHGLAEFEAVDPVLESGSVVIIDDTPIDPCLLGVAAEEYYRDHGVIPGKGSLIFTSPVFYKYRVLYHHYNLVLEKI